MIFQIKSYFKYWRNSKSLNSVDDPVLQKMLVHVLDPQKSYYPFLSLGALRKKMLLETRKIQVLDLGAGSKSLDLKQRNVSDIANKSVKKSKYAEVLFRLIERNECKKIIELGTSLGITTGYLAKANDNGKVITIEGCPETAKIASENLKLLEVKNVQLKVGNFDTELPTIFAENPKFDFIFIDGNHRKEATIAYFDLFLQHCTEDAIIVFDDIHWSAGMDEAWQYVSNHPKANCSVDIFEMGIVFLGQEYQKGKYLLKY